ncbi:trypsin-7 [Apis mellifera]|uniref:Trypsin-7 n=1 Tax=Apis mellifera TaxID=7460 RepID=A0A7M7IGH6_APIME|nr:trypsin-7 [Apis mellifera]|eukprot:XP_016768428.1 trypsin-7 [Apis mellifera]
MWRVLLLLSTVLYITHCLQPRIIGGHNASIIEYPYQVSIHYMGKHHCGGSIISENWLLTAAHCIYGLIPVNFKIRAGSIYNNNGIEYNIKNIIMHEKYNIYTFDYDVALIMLSTPIKISPTTKPIALAQSTTSVEIGKNAVVTGWGYLSVNSNSMSDILQVLTLPIVDQNVCKTIFSGINTVTENMICAGSLTGKDTCKGDSGGPLVYNNVQIGIVSWGLKCALPNYPGVYTRVSAIRDWIKKKTGV